MAIEQDEGPSAGSVGECIETLLRRFEEAWQQGRRPTLDVYLPAAGRERQVMLIELAHMDLEWRLRAGEPARAEDYLDRYAELARDREQALRLIAAEYRLRRRCEPGLHTRTYLDRFPEYGAELPARLQTASSPSPAALRKEHGDLPDSISMLSPLPSLPDVNSATVPRIGKRTNLPVLAGYEILGVLGRGGMGVVYRARQLKLNRVVALKMISREVDPGPEELVRFRREAEAAAHLHHPNIVQVYEVGEEDGQPYLVLEYVEGGNLARRLAAAPPTVGQAARLVETLARAMHYAHQRGIVHRDLKPANILLQTPSEEWGMRTEDEERKGSASSFSIPPSSFPIPKITDFGLAKLLGQEVNATRTGNILGTPCYMAPEQASGRTREVGPATDVYALGVILYELLTSRPPFRADTPVELFRQILADEPVSVRRLQANVPADLETICLKCLHKESAQRYPDAGELAEDLRRFLAHEPIRARPAGLWERGHKWARRRPALAAILAISLLAVLALAGGSAGFTVYLHEALNRRTEDLRTEHQRREQQAREHQQQREREAQQRQRLVRQTLYLSDMRLAYQFWKTGEVKRARELLVRHRPVDGDEDRRGFEWRHLWRQCDRERLVLRAAKPLRCAAFSPDGKTLAAGGDSGIQVIDAASGQVRAALTERAGSVRAVAFSPDSATLASTGPDATIQLWDSARGQPLATLRGQRSRVAGLAYSPDGKTLAARAEEGPLKLWNLVTRKEEIVASRLPAAVYHSVAFSPDGKSLAISRHSSLLLLDLAARTERDLPRPEEGLNLSSHTHGALAFSHKGRVVAVADEGTGVIRLWDVVTGRLLGALAGHQGKVHALAFAPGDRALASAGADSTVRLWDLRALKVQAILRWHTRPVAWVGFSPDGARLASASEDGTVRLWDVTVRHGRESLQPTLHPEGPIAFSPDGMTLAVANRDWTVQLMDARTCRILRSLDGPCGAVTGLAFSRDGGTIAAASEDHTVVLWDAGSGRRRAVLPGHEAAVVAVAFSPDGALLASGGKDRLVKLRELPSGRERATLRKHAGEITDLTFSPDGKQLATASLDRTVKLWETSAGRERFSLAHDGVVLSVAFTHDGAKLLTSSLPEEDRLWDPATGRPLGSFRGLLWTAISPDDQTVAGVSAWGEARLWNLRGHALQNRIEVNPSSLLSRRLAFARDNRTLALSHPGGVHLVDRARWEVRRPFGQPPGPVHSIAFSADGKTLVTGSADKPWTARSRLPFGLKGYTDTGVSGSTTGALRLWDAASGKQKAALPTSHLAALHSLALAADGRTLLAGGEGGTLWRWDLPAGICRPPCFVSESARRYWHMVAGITRLTVPIVPVFAENVGAVAISPDGKLLALASEDNAGNNTRYSNRTEQWIIRLWDVQREQLRATLPDKHDHVRCLAFAPDGKTLAANHGEQIRLWDVARGRMRRVLHGHTDVVQTMAFSAEGDTLATGGRDWRIHLWDPHRGERKATLLGHTNTVAAAAFSGDGRTLASGGWDGAVRLWSLPEGRELTALEAHAGKVHCIAFAPDGKTLASGGETEAEGPVTRGEVYLWRADPR